MHNPNISQLHSMVADKARDFLGETASGGTIDLLKKRATGLTLALEHLNGELDELTDDEQLPETFAGWSPGIVVAPDYPTD